MILSFFSAILNLCFKGPGCLVSTSISDSSVFLAVVWEVLAVPGPLSRVLLFAFYLGMRRGGFCFLSGTAVKVWSDQIRLFEGIVVSMFSFVTEHV